LTSKRLNPFLPNLEIEIQLKTRYSDSSHTLNEFEIKRCIEKCVKKKEEKLKKKTHAEEGEYSQLSINELRASRKGFSARE
jgi:hypothetical protein